MKRNSLLLSISTVVCVCLAGCAGSEEGTDEQQAAEQSPGQEQPGMSTSPEQGQTEEDGSVQAQGKTCRVVCTVQSNGSAVCPATVTGLHSTTFLGGCNKACDKAREKAVSQALPQGCTIYSCDSGNGC